MGTLRSVVEGLSIALALASLGCTAPDDSVLFQPTEARATPAETSPGTAESAGSIDHFFTPAVSPTPADSDGDGNGAAEAPELLPAPGLPSAATLDAGLARPPIDAGPSAPVAPDAGSEPPAPPPPPEPACGGALLDGICWYLGALDQACDAVCATRGGVSPASLARIGTPAQGGSLEACASVLAALGQPPASVMEGFREDQLGLGCHLFVDDAGGTSAWWLSSPAFAPDVSNPSARLACGCVR